MFNTKSEINTKQIWNQLGTYVKYIPESDRAVIDTYWKALFDGGEALFYNLAQYSIAGLIGHSDGYIEHTGERYEINKEDLEISQIDPPINFAGVSTGGAADTVYNYKITSVANGESHPSNSVIVIGNSNLSVNPNTLTWSAVSDASSYNIYGRISGQYQFITNTTNTSFSDTGIVVGSGIAPVENTSARALQYSIGDNKDYLTIPTLSGINTGTVLIENIDYRIIKGDVIEFLNPSSLPDYEIWINNQAASILPILHNIFFKSFGELKNTLKVTSGTYYIPYASSYVTASYTEQRIMLAKHLSRLANALFVRMAKGPTMKNIKESFDLLLNIPFAYNSGTIENITTGGGFTTFNIGTDEYSIPSSFTLLKNNGESVSKLEILCSGVTVHDYYSTGGAAVLATIPHTNVIIEPEKFSLAIDIPMIYSNNSYYPIFLGYFLTSVVPPNLFIWIKYNNTWLNLNDFLSILSYP